MIAEYSSCILLLNSIIGTGVLSIPYAIAVFGAFGSPMLLIASILNIISLHILAECAYLSLKRREGFNYSQIGNPTYGMISYDAIGIYGEYMTLTCILLTSFGISVSCMIEIGHTLPPLAKIIGLSVSKESSIFLTIIPILPVLLNDSLDGSSVFSKINGTFSVLLISSLFYLLFTADPQTQVLQLDNRKLSFTCAFNILIFSLQCHQNVCIKILISVFLDIFSYE